MTTGLLSKVIASADAATGLIAAANGTVQKVAGDSLGRLWARVFGDTPHDSPDNTNPSANYPVKIGGRAAPSAAGFAAPVVVDDRTDAAFDVNGRMIVAVGAMPSSSAVLTTPNPIADGTTSVYSVLAPVAGSGTGQLLIKGGSGRLRRVQAHNNSPSATLYLQVFNSVNTAGIVTGTWHWGMLAIPPGGVGEYDFSEADLACTAGIAVALSTTQTSYTAAAVTGVFCAQYA